MNAGNGGRDRRRTRLTLTALIVGAVLAGTGALVSLGVSYASYSDDGSVPLIGVQVTNRIPHSTAPASSSPRDTTTTVSTPAGTGHRVITTPDRPSTPRSTVRTTAVTPSTVPPAPPVHTAAPPTNAPPAASTPADGSTSADSGQP